MGCSPKTRHHTTAPTQLLLISLVLAQFIVQMVCSAAPPHRGAPHAGLSLAAIASGYPGHHGNAGMQRTVRVYSKCTQQYMRMKPARHRHRRSRIDTVSSDEDKHTTFLFTSVSFKEITIQSAVTKEFLCFNKKGRLIAKKNGRSKLCKFRERMHSQYSEFQSVAKPAFQLAFKKGGKRGGGRPLPGNRDQWRHKERWHRCTRFLTPPSRRGGASSGAGGVGTSDSHGEYQPFNFNNHNHPRNPSLSLT